MIFEQAPLAGAYLVDLNRLEDDRGFFARSFCRDELEAHGLNPNVAQCNVSFNAKRGVLRGMHFQAEPHAEDKLVRCTRGAIWDVVIDLRPSSGTFKKWFGIELNAASRRALYVPRGFAHGFQTLVEESEVLYMMSERFHPEGARGVRWDDPAFRIDWPIAAPILSARDREYPDFTG